MMGSVNGCQSVLHSVMEYAHNSKPLGGQPEAALGSSSHIEWAEIWETLFLPHASLQFCCEQKEKSS